MIEDLDLNKKRKIKTSTLINLVCQLDLVAMMPRNDIKNSIFSLMSVDESERFYKFHITHYLTDRFSTLSNDDIMSILCDITETTLLNQLYCLRTACGIEQTANDFHIYFKLKNSLLATYAHDTISFSESFEYDIPLFFSEAEALRKLQIRQANARS